MKYKEIEALSIIQSFDKDNIVVSFSGGKDSLVALDLAERAGVKKAIYVDTTIEFEENLEYLEIIKDFYNIKFEIIKAPINFFDMVEYVGMPSRRFRWCCDVFKFGPMTNYAKKNKLKGFITGLRKEESNKRADYDKIDKNPLIPYLQINPILDWTKKEVWSYIDKYKLPVNPLYKYFDRIGCWCCPFRTKRDWDQMEKYFPEKIDFLNKKLDFIAEKFNIKDRELYIAHQGWTYWVFSQKKINITGFSISGPNGKKEIEIDFYKNDEMIIDKIIRDNLFYAISSDIDVMDNKIIIKNVKVNNGKSNMLIKALIEKALNCIGCGACLFLCDNNALEIYKGSVHINKRKCNNCGKCLSTTPLRGGCILRNYAPRKASYVAIN